MRKILPYVLIFVIVASAFLPVSFNFKIQKTFADPIGSLTQPGSGIGTTNTTSTTSTNVQQIAQGADAKDPEFEGCGVTSIGAVMMCVAGVAYYLLYKTTSAVAYVANLVLDVFLNFSLQSDMYKSPFIVEGWGIIRDIANIFFIFILLYIAIKTILNLAGSETKKLVVEVIIIALLINFSLFFTRLVVDSSNILARVFYNNIEVKQGDQITKGAGGVGTAIMARVNPQLIFSEQVLKDVPQSTSGWWAIGVGLVAATTAAVLSGGILIPVLIGIGGALGTSFLTDGVGGAGTYALLVILASTVNVFLIYTFLSVAFLFVARTIGLWLVMIFAPLAFISRLIPWKGLGRLEYVGWDDWLDKLISFSVMAPIFTFFLYLILKFLNIQNIFPQVSQLEEADTLTKIAFIVIPFIFIIGLLMAARKVTKELSGELGKQVTEAAKTAAGVAGGALLGGAALAGRAVIGRAASALATRGAAVGPTGAGAAAAEGGVTRVPLRQVPEYTTVRRERPGTFRPYEPGRRFVERPERRRPVEELGRLTFAGPELQPAPVSPLGEAPAETGAPTPTQEFFAPTAGPTPAVTPTGPIPIFQTVTPTFKPEEIKQPLPGRPAGAGGPVPGAPAAGAPEAPAGATITGPVTITGPATITGAPKIPTGGPGTPTAGGPGGGGGIPPPLTGAPTPEKPASVSEGAKAALKTERLKAEVARAIPATETEAEKAARLRFEVKKKSLKDMAADAPKTFFGRFKGMGQMKEGRWAPDYTAFNNGLGRDMFNTLDYMANSSFDLRDTKFMKWMSKETGLDFGKAGGKGGFRKIQEDATKKELEYAKKLEASEKEMEALNEQKGELSRLEYEESQAANEAVKEEIKERRKRLEKVIKYREAKIDYVNKLRRMNYADRVEEGTLFGYGPTKIETANKIRASEKVKSDAEKIFETVKKSYEEEKKSESETTKPAPAPKPAAPKP